MSYILENNWFHWIFQTKLFEDILYAYFICNIILYSVVIIWDYWETLPNVWNKIKSMSNHGKVLTPKANAPKPSHLDITISLTTCPTELIFGH